jgi:hypothetical protein
VKLLIHSVNSFLRNDLLGRKNKERGMGCTSPFSLQYKPARGCHEEDERQRKREGEKRDSNKYPGYKMIYPGYSFG